MQSQKPSLFSGKEKHININKFAGLSRDWVGAKKLFMCFFGSFLMGEKKHINKIPQKIPGQSRENVVYVFLSLCVFFAPYIQADTPGVCNEMMESCVGRAPEARG